MIAAGRAAQPLSLSANALALRVSAARISDILRTKKPRSILADTAIRLARYFGTSPEFWLNLQSACDLSRTLAERAVQPRGDIAA